MSGWHMAVVIPARDEERLLPRCLRSVQTARLLLPEDVTCDVVVAADCCRDRTELCASEALGHQGTVVRTGFGVVGAARARAAEVALLRYVGPADRCWLANTDADCEVPSDWLLRQYRMAVSGVAAVAGRIDVDSFAEHDAGVPERFRMTYLIHADGTHPHVHGANLGVRADAYLESGGWHKLATAEDHDLWGRLREQGGRLVSDATLEVLTSGRRQGRAPMGFADALAAHNGAGR